MTAPKIETQSTDETDWDDDLTHLCCICDEYTSMCGVKLDDADWNWDEDEDEPICPLCEVADEVGCPRCGS